MGLFGHRDLTMWKLCWTNWSVKLLELETVLISIIFCLLIPTILGSVLSIIWNFIWVFFVAFGILLTLVSLYKFIIFPRSPCTILDMVITTLIAAGVTVPDMLLEGIWHVMAAKMACLGKLDREDLNYSPTQEREKPVAVVEMMNLIPKPSGRGDANELDLSGAMKDHKETQQVKPKVVRPKKKKHSVRPVATTDVEKMDVDRRESRRARRGRPDKKWT